MLTDGVEEPAAAFAKVAFGGEAYRKDIYHDVEARFFKQVGGGEIRRGNLVELLNPFGQAMKVPRRDVPPASRLQPLRR